MNRPGGAKVPGHVGLEANLRKLTLPLSDDRRRLSGGFDVRNSLALANDLLCRRIAMSCGRVGGALEAS